MGNLVFGSGAEPGRASQARGRLTESPWKEIMTLPNQTESVTLDVAKFSFSNKVVNEWNILDEEIISGCSLAGFKQKLDRHLGDKRGYIHISLFLAFFPVIVSWMTWIR